MRDPCSGWPRVPRRDRAARNGTRDTPRPRDTRRPGPGAPAAGPFPARAATPAAAGKHSRAAHYPPGSRSGAVSRSARILPALLRATPRSATQVRSPFERSSSENDLEGKERGVFGLQIRAGEKRARDVHAQRAAFETESYTRPAESVLNEGIATADAHEALVPDIETEARFRLPHLPPGAVEIGGELQIKGLRGRRTRWRSKPHIVLSPDREPSGKRIGLRLI